MSEPRTTKKEVVTAFRTGEILAAARRLMEQKGLDSLTMDEIAQAAGVAKGTLYLYFQSKDELLQALLTQVGDAMALDLEAVLAAPEPPPEKLRRAVTLLLKYVDQERELFPVYLRELVRSRSSRAGTSPFLRKHEERTLGMISRLFTEGIVSKQFIDVDPRLLAHLLKGMGRAVGYYQMTSEHREAIQEALPVVLKLLFSGIMLPPQTSEEDAT